jgi:hypothetical protein
VDITTSGYSRRAYDLTADAPADALSLLVKATCRFTLQRGQIPAHDVCGRVIGAQQPLLGGERALTLSAKLS